MREFINRLALSREVWEKKVFKLTDLICVFLFLTAKQAE